jgi:predicted permease
VRRAFRFGFGAGHVEREVDDELAFHIEMRERQLVALGMDPIAAKQEALRQFGDMSSVREFCVTLDEDRERAMKRSNRFEEVGQDLRYALRTLRRNPAFTAVVVLTLALGIGANTAIFTLIDAVILRHIPVRHAEELVAIGNTARVGSLSQGSPRADLLSYPLYRDLRDRNALVSGLVASGRMARLDVRATPNGELQHPRGRFVSGNYFQVLGVPAQIGRTFDGGEDATIGASPVVVISDGYWTRRFDRDPRAISQTITINGAGFTIIGVAPAGYAGEVVGQTNDIWMPITMQHVLMPHQKMLDDRNSSFLLALGRLKPGITLDQAKTGFATLIHQALADNATKDYPVAAAHEEKIFVSSGAKGFSRVRETYSVPLVTLMVGVALLLLIICANVANLLLARAVARSREMGIRLAIGAGRLRIVRQLLTECAVLAVLSAGAGLLVSWWGSRLLLRLASGGPAVIPLDLRMNLLVLAFTGLISILAVGIFGLVPALRASRVNLATTMRAQGRSVMSSGMGRSRFSGGKLLIAGQVAVSLVLLVGAGLLVRSLRSVQNADVGLDRDHLIMVSVNALDLGYRGERLRTLIRDLTERLARTPGVAGVTHSENGIFSGTESFSTFQIPGFKPRTADDSSAAYDNIGPGYVRAIGAHLLEGREFVATDDQRSPRVALINAAMAQFYFPGQSPIGKTIVIADTMSLSIVGVVADIRDHELTSKPPRRFYRPYLQYALGDEPGSLNFAIRTTGDPTTVIPAVRQAMKATDAGLTTDYINTLASLMWASIEQERLVARLATGFGALALLLAGIGLYGVLTYAVTRRTNEIGLRVALGAQQQDVVRMVLGDAFKLVLVGVVVGAPLAIAATRLLRNQLHDIHPADPIAIASALLVLTASALVAALLPARRAARLDPLSALRAE